MVHELVILLSSESSPITNVTFAPFRMRSPNTHITSTAPKASPVSCLRNVFESACKTRFCSPSLPFSLENFAVRAIGRRAKLLRYQIVMSKSAKSQLGARPEHQHERARCAKVHTARQKYTVCVCWGVGQDNVVGEQICTPHAPRPAAQVAASSVPLSHQSRHKPGFDCEMIKPVC